MNMCIFSTDLWQISAFLLSEYLSVNVTGASFMNVRMFFLVTQCVVVWLYWGSLSVRI